MQNTDSHLIGQRLLISGRVQGVFYRRFAKNTAETLQVSGWVRNVANGDVEVVAFGTVQQLAAYHAQLEKGPPASKVKTISVQSIAWEACVGFEIRG
jgi:acylphosphatase